MKWLFIGPRLLAGIGQVTNSYAELLKSMGHDTEYVELGHPARSSDYDVGFAFVLPIENHLQVTDQYMKLCSKKMYMTICETEPVNPAYGILSRYKNIYVASEFSRSILSRQFPDTNWKLLRHYARSPLVYTPNSKVYTFYTIGNVIDPRKNINMLLKAWEECNFKDARLLIKATCLSEFKTQIPGVIIINGLLSDDQMENIHKNSDCYINCSHSEGVGMGAVEAALRNKPVILSEYGGLSEYVKTPWMVPCTIGPIGFDDFLFTKDLQWGYPDYHALVGHMKDCYRLNVRSWNHPSTRQIMETIGQDFLRYSSET